MQKYDPMLELDRQWWEAIDDDERISVVMEHHQEAGTELPDEYAHALLHVVVENQIAMGEETPVEAILCKLVDEHFDRHDAIHAIASVLVNHMHGLMLGKDEVDNDDYYAELEKLTAEKWLHSQYNDG